MRSEQRRRHRKILAGALAAGVALALLPAIGASATEEKVGDGTWKYGVHEPCTKVYVFSDYYHSTKKHRSSVINSAGVLKRSADARGGAWSEVELATNWGGNKAYWHVY